MSYPVYPIQQAYPYSSVYRRGSAMPLNLTSAQPGNRLTNRSAFIDGVISQAPAKLLPPGSCLAAPRLLNSEERQTIKEGKMRWWPKDFGFGGWRHLFEPATNALSDPLKTTVMLTSVIMTLHALGGMFFHAASNQGKARWQGLLTKGIPNGLLEGIKMGGWGVVPITWYLVNKRDQYVKNYIETHASGATIGQMFQDAHYPKNLWTWGDRYLVRRRAKAD